MAWCAGEVDNFTTRSGVSSSVGITRDLFFLRRLMVRNKKQTNNHRRYGEDTLRDEMTVGGGDIVWIM